MHILGLSGFYHDSAACLLRDGRLVAAAQEERFSRRKHDPSFPEQAIRFCLAEAGIEVADLDTVAFYEKPIQKLDRILETALVVAPAGRKRFVDAMPSWFLDKLRVRDIVARRIGFEGEFVYARHHESHAASAFFLSPFTEAAVLTTDGVGEWATNTLGVGQNSTVRLNRQIRFPHSVGLLYSAFTQYLGFKVNNGEYKVMGLAPYGEPRFRDVILEHLLDLKEDGSYRLHLKHFDFLAGTSTIAPSFSELFGVAPRSSDGALEQVHMDLARSIQAVTEEVVHRQARFLRAESGLTKLCMAGGVALNSVANGKLLRAGMFDDLWIQPAAGDSGGCLGAALVAWHHHHGAPRTVSLTDGMQGARLGPSFSEAAIGEALEAHGLSGERLDDGAMYAEVARLIAQEAVVGWFRGRMEFGPRALGGRSILADARNADMQPRVNAKIKFREGFRPFAPSVLEGKSAEWFDLDRASPYMLLVVPVAPHRRREITEQDQRRIGLDKLRVSRSEIPAVTHVDDSARVQSVSAQTGGDYHALLTAFEALTGCPVVLNTSFNLRGEPIVHTPGDACRTFLASGMDALVIGEFLVRRPPDAEPTGVTPLPPPVVTAPRSLSHLRQFGLGGGAILALLALLNVWAGHPRVATVVAGVALLFALPGAAYPEMLRSGERFMSRVGRRIGHFNARVMLSVLFYGVVTPTGWLRRLVGADPLKQQVEPNALSYWEPAEPSPLDRDDGYYRMF